MPIYVNICNLIIRFLCDSIGIIGKVIGGDIVEYNPDRDIDNITACVAAKLLKELAGKIVDSHRL